MDSFPQEEATDRLLCPINCSQRTFAMRVVGESMEPRFHNDDIVFIDPDVNPEQGSAVIVRMPGTKEVLLRSLVLEGGQRYMKVLNPNWPGAKIQALPPDAVIHGVVIGKWVAS